MKSKLDNNMIDCTGVVDAKIETKLLRSFGHNAVNHEN